MILIQNYTRKDNIMGNEPIKTQILSVKTKYNRSA